MHKSVEKAVDDLLRENSEAQKAYQAMIQRGADKPEARAEVGRAILGCMWEVKKGMPERLSAVFEALANGKSCVELFPDALYENDQNTAH